MQEAIKAMASHVPDVVVSDRGLADGDGKDVIRQVREWSDVSIIVISARDRETEKIEALDLGTDDFVAEPFSVGELMARIHVALRNTLAPCCKGSDLSLDWIEGEPIREQAV